MGLRRWNCAAQARTTPTELRQHRSRDIGYGDIIDSMTRAARYFRSRGDDSLAARRRREKFYAGARRHHGIAVGIAREGEGAVRKRKDYAAVTHAMAIDHVGTHGHRDPDSPGCHIDDFDAQRLR